MRQRIFLISNSCTDEYPENNLTDFVNVLPLALPVRKRSRNYVALQGVTFTDNFITIPKSVIDHQRHKHLTIYKRDVKKTLIFTLQDGTRNVHSIAIQLNKRFKLWSSSVQALVFDNSKIQIQLSNCRYKIEKEFADWLQFSNSQFSNFDSARNVYYGEVGGTNSQLLRSEKDIEWKEVRPLYVRVELNNVKSIAGSLKCRQTLGVFPVRKKKRANYITYNNTTAEPCTYDFLSSRNLRITLRDENGQKLFLSSGQPTIISLVIGKNMSSSFMLRLSTWDEKASGTNVNCRFLLSEPLNLLGFPAAAWECALTSIQFTPKFVTYIKNPDLVYDFGFRLLNESSPNDQLAKISFHDVDVNCILDQNQFKDVAGLVDAINRIKLEKAAVHKWLNLLTIAEENDFIKFDCKEDGNAPIKRNILFWTSPELGYLLGMCDSTQLRQENKNILDYPHNLIMQNSQSSPQFPVDIKRLIPKYLFIYADIIASSIIGSSTAKILKFVPVPESESTEGYSYECEHLNFVSLEQSYIPSVSIQLANAAGYETMFADQKSEVLYSLLFRLKNKRK